MLPMPPLPPPQFLYVHVNKRCNLRCGHCDFWQQDDADSERYVQGERMRELLAEFASLNPRGRVVICGGESMLDLDRYFHITTTCRALGLRALSVVNGTRIRDEAMAERMVLEGPHEVSVSLNSHRAELHDRTRGVEGSFDKAVEALRLLLAARRRLGADDVRIHVMALVFDEKYRELEPFYDFVLNDVGADKMKLNLLQPSFGHGGDMDAFFVQHHRVDADRLAEVINRCDQRFGLGLNPAFKAQAAMYFRSLQGVPDLARGWGASARTTEHICNSYERNIMVDHYGVARLCFATIFPGMPLRQPGDLTRFWQLAQPVREAMRSCNRLCGISHSVRRETSTVTSWRHAHALRATGSLSSPVDSAVPSTMTAPHRIIQLVTASDRNSAP